MNSETMNQGEGVATISRQEINERLLKVCPIDPAERELCDSCA